MLLHKQKSTCVRRYYPQFFQSRLTFFITAVFSKQVEIHIIGYIIKPFSLPDSLTDAGDARDFLKER